MGAVSRTAYRRPRTAASRRSSQKFHWPDLARNRTHFPFSGHFQIDVIRHSHDANCWRLHHHFAMTKTEIIQMPKSR